MARLKKPGIIRLALWAPKKALHPFVLIGDENKMKTIFTTLALLCLYLLGSTAALAATSNLTGKAGDAIVFQCATGSHVRALSEGNQATVGCVATVTSPAAAAPTLAPVAAAPTPAPVAAAPKPAPVAAGPVRDYQGRICNQGTDRAAQWVQTREAGRTSDSWGAHRWPADWEITSLSGPLCKGINYKQQNNLLELAGVPLLRVPEGTVVPSRFDNVNGPFVPGKGKTPEYGYTIPGR